MRLLIFILLFSLTASAQVSYNFSFTTLTGDYSRPFAGSEKWQGVTSEIVSGVPAPQGFYRRISALEFATNDSNVYDWSVLRSAYLQAANLNQYLSWGYMTVCPFAEETGFNETDFYNGGFSSYPQWLNNLMLAEATDPWIGSAGHWIPNYNSPQYHRILRKWNTAIDGFLDTATVQATSGPKAGQTIALKNMTGCLDIRGVGSYGEWHHYNSAPGNNVFNFPAGTFPTVASFKAIIDAHVQPWQDYRLVCMIAAFDGQRLQNTWVPAEVSAYLLQRTTSWGLIGWRRDQWGANDNYLDFYLKDNPNVFGGYHMDTAIMNRYRYGPITGEPPGGGDFNFGGINLGAMAIQVRTYRPAWIGNGNYGGGYSSGGAWQDTMRLAFYLAGFHNRLKGGTAVVSGSNLSINLQWQNHGLAPSYDHWTVQYSLKNGAGTVVWTGNSTFDPYLFLPDYGQVTKSDVFTPGIAAGNYSLWVTVKDPENYLAPMPLQITGRQSDGSYFLSNIVLGSTPSRPSTNAGPNQSITLPDEDVTLTATSTGGVAPITYQWTQISGPVTATIVSPTSLSTVIDDLNTAGTYTFNFTATDNDGGIGSDDVIVTVNETPNIAPVAVAAADFTTITQPTESVNLNATSSTDDGSITAYLWEKISGPASFAFGTPTSSTTTFINLVPGTYTIRLTVTDDGALTDTDEITITVNAAAVLHPRIRWKYRFRN